MARSFAILQSTLFKITLIVSLALTFVISIKFLGVAIRDLRPIADDYCNATAANMSIFSNVNYWFNLWSGDVFQTVVAYVFVSKPLLELPFGIGSAFPFITGLLLISIFIFNYLKNSLVDSLTKVKKVFLFLCAFFVITGGWVTFWWLPVFTARSDQVAQTLNEQYLLTILSWQTVNSPYVIQTLISFLLVLIVLKLDVQLKNLLLASALGLLVGTSGYVLAVTLLIFVLAETILESQEFSLRTIAKTKHIYFFTFFALIGMWISGNSPGAVNRKSYLVVDPNFGAIFGEVTTGIFNWVNLVTSAEVIYAGILGAFLYQIFKLFSEFETSSKVFSVSAKLLFLSFLSYQVSIVAEIFSYKAFWHTIFSSVFIFLAAVIFGAAMSYKVETLNLDLYRPIQISLLASLLVVTTHAVNQGETRIENRRALWEVEPAPAPNGLPADREQMWINDCWLELRKLNSN